MEEQIKGIHFDSNYIVRITGACNQIAEISDAIDVLLKEKKLSIENTYEKTALPCELFYSPKAIERRDLRDNYQAVKPVFLQVAEKYKLKEINHA